MKQREKFDVLYTTIIHKYRIKHGLSNNDYCIANAIYNLSNNPESEFRGWYYGKIETLGKMFDFSRGCLEHIEYRECIKEKYAPNTYADTKSTASSKESRLSHQSLHRVRES